MENRTLEQQEKMNKAIFKKIGLDLDTVKHGDGSDSKVARGFLKGLIREYTKNMNKFTNPVAQHYCHSLVSAFMLEFRKAYENYDIRIPYRIKSPKSTLDKVLNQLSNKDKSTYFINEAGEPQGKLNEEIRDMLAMTVVATNRPPIFSYKKDPEIKGLIDEVKRNYALLEEMQNFSNQIIDDMFSGKKKKTYNYSCTREEYYINSIILIHRIKTLIHPESTDLLKRYDEMLDVIKANVPSEFFKVANKTAKDELMFGTLQTTEHIDLVRKMTQRFIDRNKLSKEDNDFLQGRMTINDTKVVNFNTILDDFTARIHDKLDLAVLTKQVQSIFAQSRILRRFDVSITDEPIKAKRTPNGYVANFLYLNTPFGLVEMQLQSAHENIEGSYGYSAHSEMEGKNFKEFPIPKEGDEEGLEKFRKSVEFVSPQKFLAQYDTSEPNRVLIQVLGKYQNYKSILSQIRKGTIRELRVQKYLDKLFASKNTIFEGEAEQEEIECFTDYDINKYLRGPELKEILEKQEENVR